MVTAQRILILGGGPGGTMVANHLARELRADIASGRVEVLQLVDSRWHTYQPGFLFMAFGDAALPAFQRDQGSLLLPGVRLVVDAAEHIDPVAGRVHTRAGKTYPYDYLVIATGSHPAPQVTPGLQEGGHGFYTAPEAARLREALARFERGRIVLTVDVPHKCPVAPLEMTFMLDSYLRRSGRRDAVEILYTYPINRVHSLAPVAEWAAGEFERRGIQSETFVNVERVDPARRVVYSLEGNEYPYDLLIAVPSHRGAPVVAASGLGDEQGFIPTDRETLQAIGDAAGRERIFVVGDATNLPVSKAGSTAHYQADVVADNLAARVRGEAPMRRYDGKVFCFIEAGNDTGTYIAFSYTRPPKPVQPTGMLHWFKLAYNELYWLSARGLL